MRSILFTIIFFFSYFNCSAQWSYLTEDTYSGPLTYAAFKLHCTGDSIIDAATLIYNRPGSGHIPVLSQIGIDGTLLDSVSLAGAIIPTIPVGFAWTNDGHYLISRDSSSVFSSITESLSKELEIRRSDNHQVQWSLKGNFIIPNFYQRDVFINSRDAFWLYNPLKNEMNALAIADGDTLLTIDSAQIASSMGLDSTYKLLNIYIEGPSWRKSDTAVVFCDFVKIDTANPITEFKGKFALFLLDSLRPISVIRDWYMAPEIDYEDYTLISSEVRYNSNNSLDRAVLKEDILTGLNIDSFEVKSLLYNPDTLNYNPDHYFHFYSRGRFSFYVEEFDFPLSELDTSLSGFDIQALKVRLYEGSVLKYENIIMDTSKSGYYDTKFRQLLPLSNGSMALNLGVYWNQIKARVLFIDSNGNHFLNPKSYDTPSVEVYPTVVSERLNIESEYYIERVQIVGAGGILYKDLKVEPEKNQIALSLMDLPSGLYFIIVSNRESHIIRKVYKN
jgi:hypothetical protein